MSVFVSVKWLLVQRQLDHLLGVHLQRPAQSQNGPDWRSLNRLRNAIFCMQKSRSFFQTKLKFSGEFLQRFSSKKSSDLVLRFVFFCTTFELRFVLGRVRNALCNPLRFFYCTHFRSALQFLLLQRLKIHSENFNSLPYSLPAEALFIWLTGLNDTDWFALGRTP